MIFKLHQSNSLQLREHLYASFEVSMRVEKERHVAIKAQYVSGQLIVLISYGDGEHQLSTTASPGGKIQKNTFFFREQASSAPWFNVLSKNVNQAAQQNNVLVRGELEDTVDELLTVRERVRQTPRTPEHQLLLESRQAEGEKSYGVARNNSVFCGKRVVNVALKTSYPHGKARGVMHVARTHGNATLTEFKLRMSWATKCYIKGRE